MISIQNKRMKTGYLISWFMAILFNPAFSYSQQRLNLKQILDSIEISHPVSKMFDADIRSMDEAAKGAKSWMPPELGVGFFMTPYDSKRWKKMSDMEPGMGSVMISIQQMFPNRTKLNADALYMQSMSGSIRERKQWVLNNLYADARKAYVAWNIIERKRMVVAENEKILEFMIRNAEIRYRNGMEKNKRLL